MFFFFFFWLRLNFYRLGWVKLNSLVIFWLIQIRPFSVFNKHVLGLLSRTPTKKDKTFVNQINHTHITHRTLHLMGLDPPRFLFSLELPHGLMMGWTSQLGYGLGLFGLKDTNNPMYSLLGGKDTFKVLILHDADFFSAKMKNKESLAWWKRWRFKPKRKKERKKESQKERKVIFYSI